MQSHPLRGSRLKQPKRYVQGSCATLVSNTAETADLPIKRDGDPVRRPRADAAFKPRRLGRQCIDRIQHKLSEGVKAHRARGPRRLGGGTRLFSQRVVTRNGSAESANSLYVHLAPTYTVVTKLMSRTCLRSACSTLTATLKINIIRDRGFPMAIK